VTDLLMLPKELAGEDINAAVRLVRSYFDLSSLGRYFSGALFERLDGGGDRPGVRNRITGADIIAVSMLSVGIPSPGIATLHARAQEISALLAGIPWDLDLVDADSAVIGPDSDAWRLWELLVGVEGIKWVTASKLLARKRPRLLPVYDSVVRAVLGHPKQFWFSLQATVAANDRALYRRLLSIREAAGVGDDISSLRIFDVVCWRVGQELASQ
jgi:hypothetical protein